MQNYARSIALDAYVLKMPLDVQIRSLGGENDQYAEMVNLVGIAVLIYCPYDMVGLTDLVFSELIFSLSGKKKYGPPIWITSKIV